jgi:hypothetical protein
MTGNIQSARGGDFATGRRGGVASDFDFILEQRARGVPASAVARMLNRNIADVRAIYDADPLRAEERPTPGQTLRAIRRAKPPPVRQASSKANVWRDMPARALAIVRAIANYYGVTVEELRGHRPQRELHPG